MVVTAEFTTVITNTVVCSLNVNIKIGFGYLGKTERFMLMLI